MNKISGSFPGGGLGLGGGYTRQRKYDVSRQEVQCGRNTVGWGGERRGRCDKNQRLCRLQVQVNYMHPSHTPNPQTRDGSEKTQGQSGKGLGHTACHWFPTA